MNFIFQHLPLAPDLVQSKDPLCITKLIHCRCKRVKSIIRAIIGAEDLFQNSKFGCEGHMHCLTN